MVVASTASQSVTPPSQLGQSPQSDNVSVKGSERTITPRHSNVCTWYPPSALSDWARCALQVIAIPTATTTDDNYRCVDNLYQASIILSALLALTVPSDELHRGPHSPRSRLVALETAERKRQSSSPAVFSRRLYEVVIVFHRLFRCLSLSLSLVDIYIN